MKTPWRVATVVFAIAVCAIAYAIITFVPFQEAKAQGTGTITGLEQWKATSSPISGITQNVYGKSVVITGIATGLCLTLDANHKLTSTSCGGVGSGASTTLLSDTNTWSGNNTFSNTITGSISGNAGTATVLQNSRNINGVAFNGSANITITAASSTLLADVNTFANAPKLGSLTGVIYGNGGVLNTKATSTATINSPLSGTLTTLGATDSLSCATASSGVAGCLNATDWATFNNKISSTSLSASFPLAYNSSTGAFTSSFSTTSNTGLSAGNLYIGSGGIMQTAASSSFFGYTPLNPTRSLTISSGNGLITLSAGAQDLSADRTWTATYTGLATSSQPASSNILVSNGLAGVYGAATTSASCSGTVSCSGFTVIGTSPITITGSASASGFLATSSPVSAGNVLVYSSTGAGSAFGIATGTVSAGSTAITVTAGRSVLGGALAIDCAASSGSQNGCLSSTDWTTFNNKMGWGQATSTSANQVVYTDANGKLTSVASSTVSVSGALTLTPSAGFLVGGSNLTVKYTGLATTTNPTQGNLFYSSGGAGVTDVATTSLSISGPFTIASPIGVLKNGAVTYTGLATTSQLASSNLLVSNGLAGVYGVATTSATINNGLTGTLTTLGSGQTIGLSSISAGVLGNAASSAAVPTTLATSTLYGSATPGQVLAYSNGGIVWMATSSTGTTYTATYPIQITGSVISTAFSTTTTNTYNALNTFNGGLTIGSLTGPLQAINGVVSATSSLSQAFGGTGSTTPLGGILAGNLTGGLKSVTIGTGLSWDGTTLSASGGGVYPFFPLSVNGTTTSATTSPIYAYGGGYFGSTTAKTYANAAGQFMMNGANYGQVVIQNLNAGANASALLAVHNDLGTDTTYYGELGINSSGYSQSAFSSQNRLDTFLNASDGGLVIGTASTTNANADLRFATGGTASSSMRFIITKPGYSFFATSTVGTSSQVTIASSTGAQLGLWDGFTSSNRWFFRTIGGNFYMGTSTQYATSTPAVLSMVQGLIRMVTTFFSDVVIASGYSFGVSTTSPSALYGMSVGTTTYWGGAQFGGNLASTTASAALYTVNWEAGNSQRFFLNQNSSFAINSTSSNPRDGFAYKLKICQDGTGSRTVTFVTPGQLRWTAGTTTISSAANTCTWIGMIFDAYTGRYDVVASSTNLLAQ